MPSKLEINLFTIETDKGTFLMFELGTVRGQWRGSDDDTAFQIVSIVNNEPSNNHYSLFFDEMLSCCIQDGKDLELIYIEDHDLKRHLIDNFRFVQMPYDEVKKDCIRWFQNRTK